MVGSRNVTQNGRGALNIFSAARAAFIKMLSDSCADKLRQATLTTAATIMTGQTNATLPKGSTILITGVNGFIASNCADQALHHGFRVRGTTRSVEEHRWMVELFSAKYGEDVFDLVEVKDMQIPGAFDSAMHGCSVVMHTASIM